MRISLINVNLLVGDAIGACIMDQVRFFIQRGDEVRVYVHDVAGDVPADIRAVARPVDLRALLAGDEEHFRLSDLFIYHYPGHYALIESIRNLDRGLVIFNYHNVTPPELWGSDEGRERLMRGVQGRALVHYADLCIVDSAFNGQELVEQAGFASDRIHVLPLAVDLARFTPGPKDPEWVKRYGLQDRRVLLYVGRMAGNKRIDLLVEALARVKEDIPNVKLLLVGDDRGNAAFRQVVSTARERAAGLGVQDDVLWTGRVDDLAAHYRLADLYMTASLHEGFGVPLIEAMASGVPVVASRAGAMPWVIGEAGVLCEPGDANDLADQALALLRDPERRHALAERGLERVKAFSLESYEAGLARILDEAVTQRLPEIYAEASATPGEPLAEPGKRSSRPTFAGSRPRAILGLLADEIHDQSDVALRDYELRSGVPLLGPLIVWVRRNLTSHLREPYLDPIIERQVSLNMRIAEWIGRVTQAWNDAERQRTELEEGVKALEAQVESLSRRLEDGS
jgi:glycosyltransferase involved in cell wall biosynthesis